jgi:NAD(P)-dependent dehydrogenase (short-subunit alcohol dehydrogenase family)
MLLAREHPSLRVNACTPGFIETDMTRHYAGSSGKSPAELGMKQPADGARAPIHLLFGALDGNGRFYGSDAKRSPLDRYRAPGSPEYTGQA